MIRTVNIANLCNDDGCTTPRHRRGPHPILKNPEIKYTSSNKQHQNPTSEDRKITAEP